MTTRRFAHSTLSMHSLGPPGVTPSVGTGLLTVPRVLACVLAFSACRLNQVADVTEGPLRFAPEQLEFAPTFLSTKATRLLKVTNPNRTSRRLTATVALPFSISESVELPAGESVEVAVHFAPEVASLSAAVVRLGDELEQLEVPVAGEGLAWLRCGESPVCGEVRFEPSRGRCETTPSTEGTDCASSSPCLLAATCQQGRCVGTANSCDDSDACTADACAVTGCARAPVICPAPVDPCLVPTCDRVGGCGTTPAADGMSCGATDCVWARVCLSGQCKKRPAPQTAACTAWEQEVYLKASNSGVADTFGGAVSLSADGTTLAVGAPLEDSVDGLSPADNSVFESGAVYVFRRQGLVWSQVAFLKASNPGNGDHFGVSLALSADGSTLVVGADGEDSDAVTINGNQASNAASQAGATYVFRLVGSAWVQQAYLKAPNAQAQDGFGAAVGVSASGDLVLVGAPREASAATGVGGAQADNTALGAGAAYLFARTGTTWTVSEYLKASNTAAGDAFGSALAVARDGLTLVVAAPREDSGSIDSGALYVFRRGAGAWGAPTLLKAPAAVMGARLGQAVAMSGTGDVVAAGAPGEGAGAAHVFTLGSWSAVVHASNAGAGDRFGAAVSLSADGATLAVGAPHEDSASVRGDDLAMNSGAVSVMRLQGSTWVERKFLKASNAGAADLFGGSSALSADGETLAIGATGESSAATGVDGDQTSDAASSAGATYVF